MTWTPISDDLAVDDRSTASAVPLLVVENDRDLRSDNARSCGHAYSAPVAVRPPTTDGGLGPIAVAVLVPRPAWLCDLVCHIVVGADSATEVTAWAAIGAGEYTRGETETVTTPQALRVTLPGVAPGDGWVVVRIGVTAEEQKEVQVTQVPVSAPSAEFDGVVLSGNGIVTSEAVEYVMPSGRSVYIGAQGSDSQWRIWPPVTDAEVIPSADTFGAELSEIELHGWSVTQRGAALVADGSVSDGAPLVSTDLPAQAERVRRHWRGRSVWAVAGPIQDPSTDHGARGTVIACEAIVPVTEQTRALRVAALVCRAGAGSVSARVEFGVSQTEYAETSGALAPITVIVRDGATAWPARDLLFRGDLPAYTVIELESPTGVPSGERIIGDVTVRADGGGVAHVAALSVLEVPE